MEENIKTKKKMSLSTQILIGLILGAIAGILLQGNPDFVNSYIKPFGTLYLNGIKMVIVPLIFCSIAVGAAGLGDVKKFGRIGLKTLVTYMVTTFIACVIGIIIANITNVGAGLNLGAAEAPDVSAMPSVLDTLINIIPSNPIASMANASTLQIIAFSLFIGAGIVVVGKKAEPVYKFLEGLNEIMLKITSVVMKFTPIGVFCLICTTLANNGKDVLLPLLSFVLIVYLGLFAHLLITYCSGIKFLVGMNPIEFIKKSWDAIVVSFTTCSSSATVPVTLECGRKLGVPLPIRSFTIPLGATINMDGSAIYQCITAMFVANLFGIHMTISQQILIIITAVLASIGTAGVAGASIIMLGTVLASVGLPLEGIAIVAGVDKLIDMPRTSINIIGDLMCSSMVAKSEGELDPEATARETSAE